MLIFVITAGNYRLKEAKEAKEVKDVEEKTVSRADLQGRVCGCPFR
jgi:hypothetical protein